MSNFENAASAYVAGKSWATGLRVGDTFLGTNPAARAAGWHDDALIGCFRIGALEVLDSLSLWTDAANVITEISYKESLA